MGEKAPDKSSVEIAKDFTIDKLPTELKKVANNVLKSNVSEENFNTAITKLSSSKDANMQSKFKAIESELKQTGLKIEDIYKIATKPSDSFDIKTYMNSYESKKINKGVVEGSTDKYNGTLEHITQNLPKEEQLPKIAEYRKILDTIDDPMAKSVAGTIDTIYGDEIKDIPVDNLNINKSESSCSTPVCGCRRLCGNLRS
jgi:hypothetical protein